MKKISTLWALGLLLTIGATSAEHQEHYSESLKKIKTTLEATGLKVFQVVIDDAKPIDGNKTCGWVRVDVEGVNHPLRVYMLLSLGGEVFPADQFTESFLQKWKRLAWNLSISVTSDFRDSRLSVPELYKEVKAKLEYVRSQMEANFKGTLLSGQYLDEMIKERETLVRRHLTYLETVTSWEGLKIVQIESLRVSKQDVLDTDTLLKKVRILKEGIEILEAAIEAKKQAFNPADGVSVKGRQEHLLSVQEMQKNLALLKSVQQTVISLVKMRNYENEAKPALAKNISEHELFVEQVATLKDLEHALKRAIYFMEHQAQGQDIGNPLNENARIYRNLLISCFELVGRAHNFGIDFVQRNPVIELGAELFKLQMNLYDLTTRPENQDSAKYRSAAIELAGKANGLYSKMTHALAQLELENNRLQEVIKSGKATENMIQKTRYFDIEIAALKLQMAETLKIERQGRFPIRR